MKTFQFQLTEDEANLVLQGLQELPAKICNPLSKKLVEQAQAQMDESGRVINHTIEDGLGAKEQLS
jgi:hypothetical protein